MKTIAALLVCFFAQTAWACSCIESTDEDEYLESSAVLLVQVMSTEFVPSTGRMEFDSVLASFRVVEEYKGSRGNLNHLRSEKTACEAPLISGDYYLVYSRGDKVEVINRCTRSRWVNLTREKDILNAYSNGR